MHLLAAHLDKDFLRFEGFARQPVGEPFDNQRTRARVADRVSLAFIDDQNFWALDFTHELVDKSQVAVFVVLSRNHEVRTGNFGGNALESERLGELIEGGPVGRFNIVLEHIKKTIAEELQQKSLVETVLQDFAVAYTFLPKREVPDA